MRFVKWYYPYVVELEARANFEKGQIFLDLLFSFVFFTLLLSVIQAEEQSMAIFNQAEKSFEKKHDLYMWGKEDLANCESKAIYSFTEEICCKESDVCMGFIHE